MASTNVISSRKTCTSVQKPRRPRAQRSEFDLETERIERQIASTAALARLMSGGTSAVW